MTNPIEQLRIVVWHKQQTGEYNSNTFAAKETEDGFDVLDWQIKADQLTKQDVIDAYPEAQSAYDETVEEAEKRAQLLQAIPTTTLESLVNGSN